MFKSLEIIFTDEGFCISKIGESDLSHKEYLLISILCKERKVIKVQVEYFNINKKSFRFYFSDKQLINASGLNFISSPKEEIRYETENDLVDKCSDDKVKYALYDSLYNFFTSTKQNEIDKIKRYFDPYMSIGDSKVKNFIEFKNNKLISQNELCMLMATYLIQMACHISFILMMENNVFSVHFGMLNFNIEKVMYNVCKNTLQDSEYALKPYLKSSSGFLNHYFNFCSDYILFWKRHLLDGPDSSIMKLNIITSCTNYIMEYEEKIKVQQEFMLDKIKREYEKLVQLQNSVCFNKREIRKTVEEILKCNYR